MKKESASATLEPGANQNGTPLPTRVIVYLKESTDGTVKKSGWYETDSLDGRTIVNKATRRLNHTELKKMNLNHDIPPADGELPTPEFLDTSRTDLPPGDVNDPPATIADDAKAIHQAAVGETVILCEATKREGGDPKIATHLVTLLDGVTTEYRHISKLGPKNGYKSARRLDGVGPNKTAGGK